MLEEPWVQGPESSEFKTKLRCLSGWGLGWEILDGLSVERGGAETHRRGGANQGKVGGDLVWLPLPAEPETEIKGPEVYLGGGPGEVRQGRGAKEMRVASRLTPGPEDHGAGLFDCQPLLICI